MKRNLLKVIGISFLVFAVLSWIIPVGTYSSGEFTSNGTDPVGIFDLFSTPVSTLLTFILYALVFACIGGLYGVMEKTGALTAWVTKVANKFNGKSKRFVVFTILFFVILSSLTGLVLPLFALVPLFAMFLFALNYDKITAMASTVGAILLGSVCSTYGFNITGYTKNLLSLDMNNQIIARVVMLVLFTTALILFVLKFGKKAEPVTIGATSSKKAKGVVKESSKTTTKNTKESSKKTTAKKSSTKTTTKKATTKKPAKKTTTRKTTKNFAIAKDVKKVNVKKSVSIIPLVIILVLLMIVTFMGMYNWYYGFGIEVFNDVHTSITGIKIGDYPIFENLLSSISQLGYWGNSEFIVMMVIASMLIAWLYKIKLNDYVESFIAGVKKMMPTAIYAALASVILTILYQASYNGTGTLVDTIYNKIGLDDFNVWAVSFSSLIGSFFYNDLYYLLSGMSVFVSGFDADALSVAGLLIQSIYGIGMIVFPTSVVLIAGLSYFDVSFKDWFKYIWKFALIILLVVIIIGLILAAL